MNNIILDCDTGEDDALAILVALANNIALRYIITSFGNSSLANATKNSAKILSLANEKEIKVLSGSSRPIKKHLIEDGVSAGNFVGKNGICNTRLPKNKFDNIIDTTEKTFTEEITRILKSDTPFDYIITGPCTNFAKVCRYLDKDIKKYIKSVYIMGGSLYTPGNTGPINPQTNMPFSEFNFYCDPYAVDIVLRSHLPIYLISWDTTSSVTIPYKDINKFTYTTPIGKFAKKLMKNFFKYYGLAYDRNFELNDPLVILAYLGYGTFTKKKIKILLNEKEFGRSISQKNGYNIYYFSANEVIKKQIIKKILSDIDLIS